MKHIQFFTDFLSDEVNLNPSRLDRLNTSVKAVTEFLSNNLDGYRRDEGQGSHALGTIIKPVGDHQEYDADRLLYMNYDGGKKPKEYIDDLYACLRTHKVYAPMVHRRTRCVFLDYTGDFHLDLIPCLIGGGGQQYICNNKTNGFEPTDGTGYRDWFNGRNRITNGNLKRVTRLLKYLRDHKKNFAVKSVLLTTLIGDAVRDADGDGDHIRTLPDTLVTISNRINEFLQRNPIMPWIGNPVLSHEDFTRHWDQNRYENFRNLFNVYNGRINKAFHATEHDDSVAQWRAVFGDAFGTMRGGNGSSRKIAAAAPFIAVRPEKPHAR